MKTKPKTVTRQPAGRRRMRKTRSNDALSNEEFRYLVEHCSELEKYRGEWLLLDGYGLAAHSPDFAQIKATVAQRGIQSPFVHYVPLEDETNYINV